MKVGAAAAGDILVAKGRVLREYHHNLDAEEIKVLQRNGFFTGFLMPAWVGDPPLDAWPKTKDYDRITTLFYVGPIRLKETVAGLKKYHIFLYRGNRVGLEGYEFRHLELAQSM